MICTPVQNINNLLVASHTSICSETWVTTQQSAVGLQKSHQCLLLNSGLVLPGLGAATAGSRWRSISVTRRGPGVGRRVQPLHVSSQEGEQSGGGVAGRLAALALQQLHQEVDVAHGQAQDLVLAQLLLRRMGRYELAEFCEGGVDVVLAPSLPGVGEHLPGHDAEHSDGRLIIMRTDLLFRF